MDINDILAPLELARQYCLEYPDRQTHYDALSEVIYSTIKWAQENGVDKRFIERHPVFQEAWNLCFPPLPPPTAQHRSNVVYLTGRLPLP